MSSAKVFFTCPPCITVVFMTETPASLVILDLCAGSGSWSKPYRESGYDVHQVTLPGLDVRTWQAYLPLHVHGILVAPPCTHLASSGARWFRTKGESALIEALSVVDACLRIIHVCNPVWWALENPVGRLVRYLGKPVMYFDPCDYGDPYTKRTALWGRFNQPLKLPVRPVPMSENPIWNQPPSNERGAIRSVTPPGFAQAFKNANP